MNFNDAIKAHSAWKTKLAIYIQNPDKSLNAAAVGKDDGCDLGRWIYGEGKQFAHLPEFQELRAEHAVFHKCAGDIIARADRGQKVTEEIALGAKSPYAQASGNVVGLLMRMNRMAA